MCACLCRNILLTAESPIHSLVVTLKLSITMTLASDKNICTLKRVLLAIAISAMYNCGKKQRRILHRKLPFASNDCKINTTRNYALRRFLRSVFIRLHNICTKTKASTVTLFA